MDAVYSVQSRLAGKERSGGNVHAELGLSSTQAWYAQRPAADACSDGTMKRATREESATPGDNREVPVDGCQ